jgi:hypothetical protein
VQIYKGTKIWLGQEKKMNLHPKICSWYGVNCAGKSICTWKPLTPVLFFETRKFEGVWHLLVWLLELKIRCERKNQSCLNCSILSSMKSQFEESIVVFWFSLVCTLSSDIQNLLEGELWLWFSCAVLLLQSWIFQLINWDG